jgi:hypothetical protein
MPKFGACELLALPWESNNAQAGWRRWVVPSAPPDVTCGIR